MKLTLGEIADQFQLECIGDSHVEIDGIASLQDASASQLSFLFSSIYKDLLITTGAAAVVVQPKNVTDAPCSVLVADNPRMAWARIAALFDMAPPMNSTVAPSAVVSDLAVVGKGVTIGANAVIDARVVIGEGASIGPGCHISEGVEIGSGTRLHANVVVYHDVVIGRRCMIHAAAVIGADGFGFEFDSSTGDFVKIPQVYGVRIGDDVEIGAGTTIDRGALNHTTIGDGVKLDNQVQIGHGTRVKHHTVISGCTAIGGSTLIGSYCLIGGAVGIIDNIEIVDQVEITAMSLVSRSIVKKGRYSSGTGLLAGSEWKRSVVVFKQLDSILKRLRRVEADQG